ncbi:MAG TPA: hypothetical protein HA271_03050 [Methanobacterium subterraneum]|uniref:Uncharacterized protein n=1 Tax=Methanobacterium subterraneum TaxID=59277 RepID=A0A7J4TJY0_9EURY|nr:hypothetical protein [Methanobacterium subterraneum]
MITTDSSGSQTPQQKDQQGIFSANNSNQPPENMNSSPVGPTGNMPPDLTNNTQLTGNQTNQTNTFQGAGGNTSNIGSNRQTRRVVDSITSSGTTVFTGKFFKIIRIEL